MDSSLQDAPVSAASDQLNATSKKCENTQIQVRLRDGSILKQIFAANKKLSSVRSWVQLKQTNDPISFMTNFPSKVFTEKDYEKTLEALNLVPSAMLIVPQTPEKIRVVYSEVTTYEAQRALKEIERKKFIEEGKRELEEDRLARQRVLAQIEDDKAARKIRSKV